MEDDNLNATFNQAVFQQARLNELMRVINFCWGNPTQYNFQWQDFNYRIIFRNLTSFYREVRPFFKTEKVKLDKLRDDLDLFIENNPVVVSTTKVTGYNKSNGTAFDSGVWITINRSLNLYQDLLFDAAHEYDLLNPVKDDDFGDSY